MSGAITWVDRPWQFTVVDDFLRYDDFMGFRKMASAFDNNVVKPETERNGNTKGHYRYAYDYDPLSNYNIMEWFDDFETKRPYTELNSLVQIVKTCCKTNYPIHNDAPHKIFSLVLYLSPEENAGTTIYDKDKNLVQVIDWKPNRAVMFCPLDNITYHDYSSTTDRFTLMYNLIDNQEK